MGSWLWRTAASVARSRCRNLYSSMGMVKTIARLPPAQCHQESFLQHYSTIPPGGFLPLWNLSDNPGSRKLKTRVGRGIGSGKGKTCGRGHKGQKARSGRKPRLGFEGGQTPLRRRLPKRGFKNHNAMTFQWVNLSKISDLVDKGLIDSSKLITMKTLKDLGAIGKKMKNGVKLLGGGSETFSKPIHIEVSRVSERAKAAIEAAGGSVRRVHYNKLGLRALYKPEWFAKKDACFQDLHGHLQRLYLKSMQLDVFLHQQLQSFLNHWKYLPPYDFCAKLAGVM